MAWHFFPYTNIHMSSHKNSEPTEAFVEIQTVVREYTAPENLKPRAAVDSPAWANSFSATLFSVCR